MNCTKKICAHRGLHMALRLDTNDYTWMVWILERSINFAVAVKANPNPKMKWVSDERALAGE